MLPNAIISMCFLALNCAADLCNWTGSGFAAGIDSRIVLQVRLRCTEGSVKWVYPGQALRVVVEPNVSSSRRSTICIKPSPSFGGASVFIERAGELELLVTEDDRPERQVFCFRTDEPHRPAIYLQARPQSDGPWSRNTIGFRYEVLGNKSAASNVGRGGLQTSCRPCNDTELLMAICNSDFVTFYTASRLVFGRDAVHGIASTCYYVKNSSPELVPYHRRTVTDVGDMQNEWTCCFVVRGHIRSVSHDSQRQTTLVEVSATRVYWQRSGLFERQVDPSGSSRPSLSWLGYIHTLLRCHVKPGDGEFLFTGSEHFGDAWLGCAPRYKDFLFVYYKARTERRNSCDFPVD